MTEPGFAAWLASPVGMAAGVAAAFVAGSMIGSFLNVVAHRVPRGESVVHGRSHCPACGAAIRPWHNVPVLGWMLLRGRCRDCHAAISPRYPLVEAACGGLAAVLAAAELWAGRGDVPEAIAVAWAARTALALAIVAWALLAAGGHDVAASTVATVAAIAALAAATVPALRPLPAWCGASAWAAADWIGSLAASAVGLVIGWTAGSLVGRPARMACATVGAALGWQVALVAVLAAGCGRAVGRRPAAACLAATAAILAWHPVARAWAAACGPIAGG